MNAIETMNSRVSEACEPEPRNRGNGAVCGVQGLRAGIRDQNGLSQSAPRRTVDFRSVVSNSLLFIRHFRHGQKRDRRPPRALGAAPCLWVLFLLSAIPVVGCSGQKSTVDPAPFLQAVTSYLQKNNMVLKVKTIKSGPTVTQDEAVMTASLTHAELGGPAVTWKLTFRRQSDGTWEVAKHEVQ